jgi:hypothetical protein
VNPDGSPWSAACENRKEELPPSLPHSFHHRKIRLRSSSLETQPPLSQTRKGTWSQRLEVLKAEALKVILCTPLLPCCI